MRIFFFVLAILTTINLHAAEGCKILKDCSEWASSKTGAKYNLGKFERRSMKFEKDFTLNEGDPDFVFNFMLQTNDLIRVKRENSYQIIQMKDLKDFKFASVKAEEIPPTFDFYSTEFSMSNKEKVKNALIIIKKFLSKNGKALEVADAPKIQVIDTGIHLNTVKLIIGELNK